MPRLHLPAPHGRLEALLDEPTAPRSVAVVCHPHPLYGGTMDNNVVYRMAKALARRGTVALRFNFRGVGASTGTHDEGHGEESDVEAALAFLTARHPGLPAWACGFSFGARVGLAVGARDGRVAKLLGIGLVPRMFDLGFLEDCRKPKAIVHAERDELGDVNDVRQLVDRLPEPKRLVVVPEATHLFAGRIDAVEAAVETCIDFLEST